MDYLTLYYIMRLKSDKEVYIGYKDDDYNECILAWTCRELCQKWIDDIGLKYIAEPIAYGELLIEAMSKEMNIILDLVYRFNQFILIKTKERIEKYQNDIELIEYLMKPEDEQLSKQELFKTMCRVLVDDRHLEFDDEKDSHI